MSTTTKWVEGTVVEQRRWSDRIYSLRVTAEIGSFEAGQHATLALPVGGVLVTRPYSFVNAPKEQPHEFHYMLLPEGPLTTRLARLEARDVVFLAPTALAAQGPACEDGRCGSPARRKVRS